MMQAKTIAAPTDQKARESALERFSCYFRKLQELREGNITDEYLQRELLVDFLRINAHMLSDLPKNTLQQVGVVNLICQRSFKHPRFSNLDNILQGFSTDVARMMQTNPKEEPDLFEKRFSFACNAEMLLLRLLQSVVRVQADVVGGFRDIITSIYGKTGTEKFDEYYGQMEFSPAFWRTIIDYFVKNKLSAAYEDVTRKAKYNYSRTPKTVRINFQFDLILEELSREGVLVQRENRFRPYIQTQVEEFEYKRIRQVVSDFLRENKDFYLEDKADDDAVQQIIAMVCFDLSAAEYKRAAVEQAMRSVEWEDVVKNEEQELLDRFDMIKGKLLAAALGVSIAYYTMQRDFVEAMNVFSAKNMHIYEQKDIENAARLMRFFDKDGLEQTLMYMLESYFFNILRRKCLDKKEKIKIQSLHKKRIHVDTLEQLYHFGLTRIQKNKIFNPDAYNQDMVEFRMLHYEVLEKLYELLQMPAHLRDRVRQVWEMASNKVVFYVIIDLAMISKTSTDIKRSLTEILYKYNIVV